MVGVYVLTPKHVDTEADETHTPFCWVAAFSMRQAEFIKSYKKY